MNILLHHDVQFFFVYILWCIRLNISQTWVCYSTGTKSICYKPSNDDEGLTSWVSNNADMWSAVLQRCSKYHATKTPGLSLYEVNHNRLTHVSVLKVAVVHTWTCRQLKCLYCPHRGSTGWGQTPGVLLPQRVWCLWTDTWKSTSLQSHCSPTLKGTHCTWT